MGLPSALKPARVNVKVLILVFVAVIMAVVLLWFGHSMRKRWIINDALAQGQKAYAQSDWPSACRHFRTYLSQRPDDYSILEKYATAQMAVRPLEQENIQAAMGTWRKMYRIQPEDPSVFQRLASMNFDIRNFNELSYFARTRLEKHPHDPNALLWLAKAHLGQRKAAEARGILDELIPRIQTQKDMAGLYVQASLLMSTLESQTESVAGAKNCRKWLDSALHADPQSVQALLARARLSRLVATTDIAQREPLIESAKADLDVVEGLNPPDPRIRLLVAEEWLKLNKPDRAAQQVAATDNLTDTTIDKYFSNAKDYVITRFLVQSQIVLRSPSSPAGSGLAMQTLSQLSLPRHRLAVLPQAIRLFIRDNNISQARKLLNEYKDSILLQETPPETTETLLVLESIILLGEDRPYQVIDLLNPVLNRQAVRDELLLVLADAYVRVDQTRRAIALLEVYCKRLPGDAVILQKLIDLHAGQGNWSRIRGLLNSKAFKGSLNFQIQLSGIEADINLAVGKPQNQKAKILNEATSELKRMKSIHPDNSEVRRLLAAVAKEKKDPETARKELTSAISQCKDTLSVRLELAQYYARQKQFAKAIDTVRQAARVYPGEIRVWIALSDYYQANRQFPQALESLQLGIKSITNSNEKNRIRLRIALLEMIHMDRGRGIAQLKQMANDNPKDLGVRVTLLATPEIMHNVPQAQALIEQMKGIEGAGGTWWRLCQANLWLGQSDWRTRRKPIEDMLVQCVESDPGWPAPALALGQLNERLNKWQNAERVYRRVISINPDTHDVADRLVRLLETQNRFADAREVYDQLHANPLVMAEGKIRLAVRAGDYAQAVEELNVCIANNPRDINSRVLLARLIYQQTKNQALAFEQLDQAEQINPHSTAILVARVAILKAEGKENEGRVILDQRVKAVPSFESFMLRGDYFLALGKNDLAEKDYRRLPSLSKDGQGYELLGKFYADTRRLDQAIAAWKEGSDRYPKHAALKRRLLKALLLRSGPGDQEQANRYLADLSAENRDDPDLLWVQSLVYLSKGDSDSLGRGEKLLQEVVEMNPTAVDAHLRLIGLAMRNEDFAAARNRAIQALAVNPDNRRLILARAQAEVSLGNISAAIEMANLVLSDDPFNYDACDVLVEAARSSGDPKLLREVEGNIDRVRSQASNDPRWGILKARVLDLRGEAGLGLKLLEQLRQNNTSAMRMSVLLNLAQMHRAGKDFAAAGKDLDEAQRLAPDNPLILRERVYWLGEQKKYDQVYMLLAQVTAKLKNEPKVLDAAAAVLTGSTNPLHLKQAMKLMEAWLSFAPESLPAKLRLAWLAYLTGDTDRVETLYRQILSRDPGNLQALNNLAWVLSETRHNHDEALRLINRGLASSSRDTNLLDTRGTILAQISGKEKEAKTDFETCLRRFPVRGPDSARTLVKLGRVCALLGERDQAKKYLDQAMQLDHQNRFLSPSEQSQLQEAYRLISEKKL